VSHNRPIHGGNLSWAVSIADCPISSILDFSASINPLGIPETAIATIKDNLFQLKNYPDPHYEKLRECLGEYHGISAEWILPGNGSAELLSYACRELAQKDLTYVLTPAFHDYERALRAFDGKIKNCLINLDDFSEDFLTDFPLSFPECNFNPNCGFLLNNPHNPTGKLFKKDEIKTYLDQFALVVIDEAFMDFLAPENDQSLISLIEDFPNLIILRSLTKFYSIPGLRIGYVITHPDRLKKWQNWRDPWAVNILADLVAQTVIKDEEFRQKTLQWLPPARLNLWQELSNIEGLSPLKSTVNFLLVKTVFSSVKLQEYLLKNHQILIRDCLSFPELGDNYFRIAVKLEQENNRLVNGLKLAINNRMINYSNPK
jgi:L-threonine-O-3-phosphate decarboxylase